MSAPVQARDLALYFFKIKEKDVTPSEIKKSIAQVKSLLRKGYSAEQIKGAIDRYSDRMYSLGYLFKAIDTYIGEEILKEEQEKDMKTLPRGGKTDQNKEKYERASNKSRFGTERYLHLFEKPEDDK